MVPQHWLQKHEADIVSHFACSGPMVSVNINGISVSTILDTGSTFTLIPHTIWRKLKLNPNLLDTSTTYNIKSASHTNLNAVLGSLTLDIEMKTTSGDTLVANLKCLVLRPDLNLGIVSWALIS